MLALREAVASVEALVGYVGVVDGRPYDYAYPPPPGTPWHNYGPHPSTVTVTDARGLAPSLAREGFGLLQTPVGLSEHADAAEIESVYYPELVRLARAASGAREAHVFDHLVRRREGRLTSFGRQVSGPAPSANGRVHNDYTRASGPRRMAQVVGDARAERIGRYAIVNIWRPLRGPVYDAPLALCDARTVTPQDLVASDVHYRTRTGEIYLVRPSPRHRWFYFSAMQPHEALVFKQYDSAAGAPSFVPHAAFELPDAPADALPRVSIEARCLVVF